ncbi:MAG TPA: 4-alpha-glucanotransferase [Candidatus Limnocylindria bacterium]|nr:4-alpha-glucanotransferase [Candidatus Limnocylindria bacterium]
MSGAERVAGVLCPLFALRGRGDWGIGEIGHLPAFCRWLSDAGHRALQLLPIFEVSAGERSPYAALTAFALDPIYLSLDAVEDFAAAGGEATVGAALETSRAARDIDYDAVRAVKRRALEVAFARFLATEWEGGSARAEVFRRFCAAESAWLDDYALFRALRDQRAGRAWATWEPPLRDRRPAALVEARDALARVRLFHAYVQWVAAEQWAAARREATAAGVRLLGDLAFMLSADSADVWSRQEEFACDLSLGAPPDALARDGQDWGLPVYRWEVMARNDHAWLRARVARAAALFAGFRLDHVVGFYRQWVIPSAGPGRFVPADEAEQLPLGERLLGVVRAAAGPAEVTGEDLGVVPDFVRRSLATLGIPGYRVLRWESDGGAFRDPAAFPPLSVATSGTHDTSALAAWWEEELGADGRRALAAVPSFGRLAGAGARFTPAVHEALLDGLYAAASALVVLPFADAYGGRERINLPGTVGPPNWGYRVPWNVEDLCGSAGAALRDRLRALAVRHGRS